MNGLLGFLENIAITLYRWGLECIAARVRDAEKDKEEALSYIKEFDDFIESVVGSSKYIDKTDWDIEDIKKHLK